MEVRTADRVIRLPDSQDRHGNQDGARQRPAAIPTVLPCRPDRREPDGQGAAQRFLPRADERRACLAAAPADRPAPSHLRCRCALGRRHRRPAARRRNGCAHRDRHRRHLAPRQGHVLHPFGLSTHHAGRHSVVLARGARPLPHQRLPRTEPEIRQPAKPRHV
ncbi:unknown [Prevotella sp. CAG:755]|nr:unknown [Prevotella sp. CAG:755]